MTGRSAGRLGLLGVVLAVTVISAGATAANAGAQVRAGAAKVDASWHVGASAGQYAGDCVTDPALEAIESQEAPDPAEQCGAAYDAANGNWDPTAHAVRRRPSYGMQSRLEVRALVVEGPAGNRIAIAKTDLYIPQDLLYRRAAQLLEERGDCGIGRETLTMATTHNHSSPMYSSSSWGVWAFQDVIDVRFFNYMAERIYEAVERACDGLVPVRVGASVGQFDKTHRHSFGPDEADDGTPAGYPNSETDHDLTVLRFDRLSGEPLANLVNFSLHPEFLEGNDLISADYVAPLERITDRRTGALTVWTQGAVGTAEPERSTYHSIHERLEFSHKDYAQAEYGASLMSDAIVDVWRDVEAGTPEDPSRYVPFDSDFEVDMEDRWYPGPFSHPYPGVSNCRTDKGLEDDARLPVVGLPTCQGVGFGLGSLAEALGLPEPPPQEDPVEDPGLNTDDFQAAGIPVPENYSAPSYTGLQEDIDVHLQGIRLGDIYLPVCSCEQWFDQSRNIETRTDTEAGNEWLGYDWGAQCVETNPAQRDDPTVYRPYTAPGPSGTGTWSCPRPSDPENESARLVISDHEYRRMRAQVLNPANGWNDAENAATAESEPTEVTEIKGNYTHDDDETSAALGYGLTVPIAMANDYNGYIATYREYQRGDHYRKSLTGWGPHSSDYLASRLVTIGRLMHSEDDGMPAAPIPRDQEQEAPLAAKAEADTSLNDARAAALGTVGGGATAAYDALLPDDGGEAGAVEGGQPEDIERFGAALFTWNGGSNYTDNPSVVVERRVGGEWTTFADQSGEVPVTLEYPESPADGPVYMQGEQEWHWTAHFEAFVAPFEVGAERATPAGTYRFAVEGERRDGGRPVPYRVTSEEFAVSPWSGITVEDLRVDPDGRVSFHAGPVSTYTVGGPDSDVDVVGGGPAIEATVGPIDYPDSHESTARFIRERRTAYRDPAAPGDPDRLEWFCFTCSFRPWLDAGDAETVEISFVGGSGEVESVPARLEESRWVSERPLAADEGAFVDAGCVRDRYGNFNGDRSAAVGALAEPPEAPGCGSPSAEEPLPGDPGTPPGDPGTPPGGDPPPAGGDDGGPGTVLPAPGPAGSAACVRGSKRDERMNGGPEDDCLKGGRGSDRLRGGAGDDTLSGGPGDDLIVAGPGVDAVRCGPGRDTARVDSLDGTRGCERVHRRG